MIERRSELKAREILRQGPGNVRSHLGNAHPIFNKRTAFRIILGEARRPIPCTHGHCGYRSHLADFGHVHGRLEGHASRRRGHTRYPRTKTREKRIRGGLGDDARIDAEGDVWRSGVGGERRSSGVCSGGPGSLVPPLPLLLMG
jgi:hypothetical protein